MMEEEWRAYLREHDPKLYEDMLISLEWSLQWRDDKIVALEAELKKRKGNGPWCERCGAPLVCTGHVGCSVETMTDRYECIECDLYPQALRDLETYKKAWELDHGVK